MNRNSILIQVNNMYTRYKMKRERKVEIDKIHEDRRIKIYDSITLSKQQTDEIDRFFLKNLGEKVGYEWHREYSAYTGNFDYRYFPEILYIPEFEKYMNPNMSYNTVFENKNILPIIARNIGIRTPVSVLSSRNGVFSFDNRSCERIREACVFLKQFDDDVLFAKPSVGSSSGRGCFKLKTNSYNIMELKALIEGLGPDFVIQKCLDCSQDIKRLNSNTVNTFRVITYRWKKKVYHMPIIMRIGRENAEVDNAHAGGMFIGVSDTGVLKKTAFTEFHSTFDIHPDSKEVFLGYQISNFDKVINTAHTMALQLPEVGVINWDFTIDSDEQPVLIEANIGGGSIWLTQMANGIGCFEDRTAEVLRWIRKMRHVSPDNYSKHMCGY